MANLYFRLIFVLATATTMLHACSPQMKAIQESINTPCVKCSEIRVESTNCASQADVLLPQGGQCGRASIDYTLDAKQCAQVHLTCAPPFPGLLPTTTVWSTNGFTGRRPHKDEETPNSKSILELGRAEKRVGETLALNLVCNDHSKWELAEEGIGDTRSGNERFLAIPNPVTLYCLSEVGQGADNIGNGRRRHGSTRTSTAATTQLETSGQRPVPIFSSLGGDVYSSGRGEGQTIGENLPTVVAGRGNPAPTFSIAQLPFTNAKSKPQQQQLFTDPNSIGNFSAALIPLLKLLGR